MSEEDAGLGVVIELFENISSPNHAAEIRGQVSRYLESYPDHPGFLMLRCLAELYTRNGSPIVVKEHFLASLESLTKSYEISDSTRTHFINWAMSRVATRNERLATELMPDTLERHGTRGLSRELIGTLPAECITAAKWHLLMRQVRRIASLGKEPAE